jgi:hypothetical protein
LLRNLFVEAREKHVNHKEDVAVKVNILENDDTVKNTRKV